VSGVSRLYLTCTVVLRVTADIYFQTLKATQYGIIDEFD